MSPDIQTLIDEAKKASEKAYAPYSKFKVGAAILTESGKLYTGCNVENVSYGGTICAERTAAVKAVSDGEDKFAAIAVYAGLDGYCYPCGICRQFLAEFAVPGMKIYACGKTGAYKIHTMEDILPYAFKEF